MRKEGAVDGMDGLKRSEDTEIIGTVEPTKTMMISRTMTTGAGTVRTCPAVKRSYGLCIYTPRRSFFVIQNRDSEAFIFFFMIRNLEKWDFSRFRRILSHCTRDEIDRLLYYPFDRVYSDLYVNHKPGTFEDKIRIARKNYELLHSRSEWFSFAMTCPGKPISWGFPKGRIEKNETPLDCAIREFQEETNCVDTRLLQRLRDSASSQNTLSFTKYKPFFRFTVVVELFCVCLPNEFVVPVYSHFPHALRPVSLSNECLHGRWIAKEYLSSFVCPNTCKELQEWETRYRPFLSYPVCFLDSGVPTSSEPPPVRLDHDPPNKEEEREIQLEKEKHHHREYDDSRRNGDRFHCQQLDKVLLSPVSSPAERVLTGK